MGWLSNSADAVRSAFRQMPEVKAAKAARGMQTGPELFGIDASNMTGGVYSDLQALLEIELDLHRRYVDYEAMDDFPELSSALDIYADDTTTPDFIRGQTIWVNSEDDWAKATLTDLYHGVLRVEEDIWPNTRTLCKYGNSFAEILLGRRGVLGLNFLPCPSVRRLVDHTGMTAGFMQDPLMRFDGALPELQQLYKNGKIRIDDETRQKATTGAVIPFEEWEIVHWRLRMKHMRSIYGHSVLEAARWVWRRLAILEDSVLIYRLTRAPERLAFFVDVGNLPANEALGYLNKVRTMYKKKKFYNADKGGLDMRHNPMSNADDFWIPSRDGKDSTRVETLGGLSYQSMDDIDYFRKKLQGAIKMPPAYLGLMDEAVGQQLSHADARFARTILRVQREVRNGYKRVGRVHLSALGKDADRVKWDLQMSIPTTIFELAQIEALSAKAQIARDMKEDVSLLWVLTNLYKFSEDEAMQVMRQRGKEVVRNAEVEAEAEIAGNKKRDAAGFAGPDGAAVPQGPEVRRVAAEPREQAVVERMLQEGNAASERRLTSRIDEVLAGNTRISKELRGTHALMAELQGAMRGR